jgi:hypothetical protein
VVGRRVVLRSDIVGLGGIFGSVFWVVFGCRGGSRGRRLFCGQPARGGGLEAEMKSPTWSLAIRSVHAYLHVTFVCRVNTQLGLDVPVFSRTTAARPRCNAASRCCHAPLLRRLLPIDRPVRQPYEIMCSWSQPCSQAHKQHYDGKKQEESNLRA